MWCDKIQKIRTNVLLLMGMGYGVVFISFLVLAIHASYNLKPEDGIGTALAAAYEVIESPLMVLIGGSIAISKDIIKDD